VQWYLIHYGLLAVFLAAAIEADIVPVLTGVLAHLGFVEVTPAILCATAGALSGDCVWYFAGRFYSDQVKASSTYRKAGPLAERLTARFGDWQIPASHLIYGSRIATMVLSGIRGLSLPRFVFIDGLGCICLTTFLFTMGFLFSSNAEQIITDMKRVELFLLIAAVFSVLFFYLMRRVRQSA
jgi:membrane protein DedA with SNARE-associated domain